MEKSKLENKLKNEKGSITIFVLSSMIFFLVILLSIYMSNMNKKTNINKDIKKIKEEYTVTDQELENEYKNIISKNEVNIPKTWAEKKLTGDSSDFTGEIYYPAGTTKQEFPELLGYPDEARNAEDVTTKGKSAITVSATVKPQGINGMVEKFIVGNSADVGWKITMPIAVGKAGVIFSVSKEENSWESLSANISLDVQKVYNIIATFTRKKMIIDVTADGIETRTFTKDTEITSLDQLDDINTLIGGDPKSKSDTDFNNSKIDNGTGFSGNIYEVKIWDRVLTKEQRAKVAKEQIEIYKDQ